MLAATWVGIGPNESFVINPPATWVECLIIVTAGAVYLARRQPFAALAVTAILDALPFWLPIGGFGYHLGLMLAVYTVVAHCPPRRAYPAAGAVLIAQVCLMSYDMGWRWMSVFVHIAALTVALPIVLGIAAHARARATEALRERALAAERSRDADARQLLAEDRLRVARDLHDTVAHQIAVMNLNTGVATRSLREHPDDAENALITARVAGRTVISSISDLLTALREGDIDQKPVYDLADAHALVDEFRTLDLDLDVRFDGPGAESLDRVISPTLFAVLREVLTNAYKHGRHDQPVQIRIALDAGRSTLVASNTPSGRTSSEHGFGLKGMRERVADAGGQLVVHRDLGRFVLEAEVPEL